MRIFLVGFMGSGKSYLAKTLAKTLAAPFVDLDALIEERQRTTISSLFAEQGETNFRLIERDELRGLLSLRQIIVATGGGTPCFHQNMDWMCQQGITIFLDTPVHTLYDRLRQERADRPLVRHLSDQELLSYINDLRWQRLPFYNKAHLTVQVDADQTSHVIRLARQIQRVVR